MKSFIHSTQTIRVAIVGFCLTTCIAFSGSAQSNQAQSNTNNPSNAQTNSGAYHFHTKMRVSDPVAHPRGGSGLADTKHIQQQNNQQAPQQGTPSNQKTK